ncbi:hypothetical protein SERLA73DRAFT_177164 [Serpula lacrymans var. lacrymans S7.3]|uniref:FAD-binding FR-type domain-containing protein n=2 Tax=Serpula lacrymans var. lacrymans TaxID=341189 RepID=F8PNI5_SERL3|nr:uncharacterized protein SERLADRAFT_460620 [Serpula lacrymans var. lacrymans S7.9]EGO01712.1 hypothetical protein SERLA73DRAFT_177164 [Serpula lacrymans var. lacrymans S7.3]EGO27355.1 hypothetical protein SERLADRAFT_460620 [Serpula lacrymans var. lacrymans S7.9]
MLRFKNCCTHNRRHIVSARRLSSGVSNGLRKAGPFLLFGGIGIGIAAYFLLPDESRSAPTYRSKSLAPSHFTPTTLISTAVSGPDTKLLTLAVPPELVPTNGRQSLAPIWSIFIKDDDIQVERQYTPLEGIDNNGHMKLWIKKYEKGEVGRWLHSKNIGDSIEIRGPLTTWPWTEDHWDEIVMISGGTGLAPFYQLVHNVMSENLAKNKTRYTLLHSSKTRADLPPSTMLQPLLEQAAKHSDKFRLEFFVDSLEGLQNPNLPDNKILVGRIDKSAIQSSLGMDNSYSWWQKLLTGATAPLKPPDKKILFLVCGPEPMISAIAGPYGRNFSQGAVGGIIGEMGYKPHEVWKL